MTKHTTRDEVWSEALRHALLEDSFNINQIQERTEAEASDRTVRDTLNTMVDFGWLAKDSPRAHEWRPGEKCQGIEGVEENFKISAQTQEVVRSDVDEVYRWRIDRVSNSGNLVIEKADAGHLLGTHGCIEEYVKIPYSDGKPVRVSLPRLDQERVLVCREQSVVRGNDCIQSVKQPELRVGDIVLVHVPILINADDTRKEVSPDELNGVPLPLFRNVDTLQIDDASDYKSEWRHIIEITSISGEVASGTVTDRSKWSRSSGSGNSSGNSLDDIAASVGTTTTSAQSTGLRNLQSNWDSRRRELLREVSNTYD